jgi:hypothetical protein
MRIPQVLGVGIAVFLALCVVHADAESTIFKCTKADGSSVFSPTPCGKDAKEIGVPKSSSLSVSPSNDAVRDISNSVSDSRCRDDAQRLNVEPDTSAIARAEADIRATEHRYWVGDSAQAQQMASDDATRVVGLRNVIATERARVDVQRAESRKRVDEALAKCEDQKRRRDESQGR